MAVNTERDIQALVSMMDEPDPEIYKEISSRLVSCGYDAMPFLENAYYSTIDTTMRQRLDSLLHRIRYNRLSKSLTDSGIHSNKDLLEAWFDITGYFYPTFDKKEVQKQLEAIRKDIWLEMNDNLTALEQIKVFNHVFYNIHNFKGNIDDYHNPENSFIHKVFQSRIGNPLSLGVIYMLVARNVELPVRGINLPEHFVLAYMGERFDTESMTIHHNRPLFYIDAFSSGSIFSANGINTFLHQLNMDPLPAFFEPCSNAEIIIRMLNNIIVAFDQAGQNNKTVGLDSLRDKLQGLS